MLTVMIMIFVFSSQNGEASSEQSNFIGELIVNALGIEVPDGKTASDVYIIFGFNIRNCAHIFLYAMLGLTSFLFAASLFRLKDKRKGFGLLYIALSALAISFVYACLDELHQYFIGGRTASWRDIGIDAIGFTLLIGLCCAFSLLWDFLEKRRRIRKANGFGHENLEE